MKYIKYLLIFLAVIAINTKAQEIKEYQNQKEIAITVIEAIKSSDIRVLDHILIPADVLKKKVPALQYESSEMIADNIHNNPLLIESFNKIVKNVHEEKFPIVKIQYLGSQVKDEIKQTSEIIPPKTLFVMFELDGEKGYFEVGVADDKDKIYLVELMNSDDFFKN